MIERIWMHIGAEKTGTTSLQYWLMNNRQALRERGVLFPESPGKFNHIALAAYAMDDSKGMGDLRTACGGDKFASVAAFRQHLRQELEKEVGGSDSQEMVFSNEHCSSRLMSVQEVERLRDLLYRFCEDVRIVLYIREPVEFFASWYATLIASGGTTEFPKKLTPGLIRAADWLAMADRWSDVFGPRAVKLRRFESDRLVGRDVISDFCSTVGWDVESFSKSPKANQSLGLKALLFLRKLNETLPWMENGAFNPDRGRIVEVLSSFPDGHKFTLPPEMAGQVREHYAESHDRLKRIYFPQEGGPLFSGKEVERQEIVHLTDEDYIALARHLWVNRKAPT